MEYFSFSMPTNNTQSGQIPLELLDIPNGYKSNIDQLVSIKAVTTNQSSSIQRNPTNMISTIQDQAHGLAAQHVQQEQRQRQQNQERRQQQQQLERQRRRRERNQHRYDQWQVHLYQRQQDRYRRQQQEQDHEEYLCHRSPTFDEGMDEILGERELEEYYLQGMTPQERQEIREQDQLNELRRNPARQPHGLPLDNFERYAKLLQDQQRQDEHHQIMRIYDLQNSDYHKQCRRHDELLMQNEEWEDMAYHLQQFN